METSLWWSKPPPSCCLRKGKRKKAQKSKPSFGAEEHPHGPNRNPGPSAVRLRHHQSVLMVGAIQTWASLHQLAMQPGKSFTWPCNQGRLSPLLETAKGNKVFSLGGTVHPKKANWNRVLLGNSDCSMDLWIPSKGVRGKLQNTWVFHFLLLSL